MVAKLFSRLFTKEIDSNSKAKQLDYQPHVFNQNNFCLLYPQCTNPEQQLVSKTWKTFIQILKLQGVQTGLIQIVTFTQLSILIQSFLLFWCQYQFGSCWDTNFRNNQCMCLYIFRIEMSTLDSRDFSIHCVKNFYSAAKTQSFLNTEDRALKHHIK